MKTITKAKQIMREDQNAKQSKPKTPSPDTEVPNPGPQGLQF